MIKIFRNFSSNRNIWKFDQNQSFSKFSENLPKIAIFRIFGKNWNFSTIFTEIEIFLNIWPKSKFFESLTLIEIFLNFGKNRFFSEILTKVEFFENFTKIEIFRNFREENNQNFSKIL